MPKPKTMTDTLRKAIATCGVSRYRIAKESGVDPSTLLRFVRGAQTIRLDKADALATYFGLELVSKKGK